MMKKRLLFAAKNTWLACDRFAVRRVSLLAALLVAPSAVNAQSLSNFLGNKAPESAAQAPVDPLNRTTPRSAILNFLEVCHAQRYVVAARYLDLRKVPAGQRPTEGPELARQLADLLDKEPRFEVDQLSDHPAGSLRDGLAPDMETLVKLNTSEEPSTLFLQRIQEQGMNVWVVSSDSVTHISALDALESSSDIEKRMPKFLVRHEILGTALWAWISLIVLTLLLFGLSSLLSRLFLAIFTLVVKRFAKSLQSAKGVEAIRGPDTAPVLHELLQGYRLQTLTDPLRLLISLGVFRALMGLVTPSALLRDYLTKLLVLLSTLGLAALAMRIIDLASTQVLSRLAPSERALSYSLLPLGLRVIRIGIFLLAALLILASWGYNTNAILAGLGVGGLAVALAAQKTIENLFGAVALISDRPVLVGDFCQFGTQSGTVEDIGLRSTRIRTNDRTLVTVPNSSFSTMTIENFSRRDRIWFHPTLRLRHDTSPGKVREMMDAAAEILRADPLVQPADVPIRFTKITDYSLDLEIFAYVATADFNEYLKVQSALLLKFLEASQQHGVGFAVPLSESITVNPQDPGPLGSSSSHPDAEPPAAPPRPG
jgi:MscS family membrane protein